MIHVAEYLAAFLFLCAVALGVLLLIVGSIDEAIHRHEARYRAERERKAIEWARNLSREESREWLPLVRERGMAGLMSAWEQAMARQPPGFWERCRRALARRQ